MNKHFTPPHYPNWLKLIIFTVRIFYPYLLTPHPLCPYPLLSILIIFFNISIYSLKKVLIMDIYIYMLNITKYLYRWPKKHQKDPKFKKKNIYPHCPTHSPLAYPPFLKLIIFTIRNFFYQHARTVP